MSSNDAYETLAAGLGYPGSSRLRAVMEGLMTPEQAQMVAALPASPAEVVEKTGFADDAVAKALNELALIGVVHPKGDFSNRDYFYFTKHIVVFLDSTSGTQKRDVVKDKAFYERWDDFCVHEMNPTVGRQNAKLESPPMRIVPAYKAIKDLPDVAPHEDFRELLKAQERIALIPCPCRQRRTAAGHECEYTEEEGGWKCLLFGKGADNIIARGAGREISIEEALEVLETIEDDGLLHTWPNNTNMTDVYFSCQCCRDCCLMYLPLESVGESIGYMWAKSRFEAFIDQDKCEGCQDCVERCQFDAIEMIKPKQGSGNEKKRSKKLKAQVDPEKCWGCGVCVMACDETKALGFKQVRPLDHVPAGV